MACLLTSATCHLFGCCSAHVTALLWRFDYAGIAVLIVASFFPPVYYSFLCSPWTRLFYLVTTSVLGERLGQPRFCIGEMGGAGPRLLLMPWQSA
jgi:adiponectin receptor